MLIITSILTLIAGVVLCFFGYRSFRAAMTVAGFVIGAMLGLALEALVVDALPGLGPELWMLIFMGVGGLLGAALSFRLFRSALFYVTMFVTTFSVLKGFLLSSTTGMGMYSFFRILFGKLPNGEVLRNIDSATTPDPVFSGFFAKLFEMLPGEQLFDKLWVVFAVACLLGAVAGIVVCALQKPAIIVVTSVFGGIMIAQGISILVGIEWSGDVLGTGINQVVSGGSVRPELSLILTVVAIVAGIVVQNRTVKKLKQ